ncbi:MAG: T9SS type A sorting domain-containing protein [Bacteroidales bacterium]|nr:T9SS type A sorting domain-containing protein [Bacteroidales bacterium]
MYDPGYATSIDNSIIKPVRFQLHQNYPNPFNLLTTIKYSLTRSDFVTIKICNLVGQEVELLVNAFQTAGDHQITWEAEGVPRGIYFYTLQTGEFSETKKLHLQK